MVGGAGAAVTVADVLELRSTGLTVSETWSLLCQATQALQDLFLSSCVLLEKMVPRITPSNLQVTSRGRVKLAISDTESGEQCEEFLAPEYRPGVQAACEASLEKMLIFSLGKSLQQVLKGAEHEQGYLSSVLESMVCPHPASRASLMDLLDAISEYCKARIESRPFSHLMMDLYREALETTPQCLPAKGNVMQPDTVMSSTQRRTNSFPKDYQRRLTSEDGLMKIKKSCSQNTKTERPLSRRPVQRAPSRLYRATAATSREIDSHSKYCCPNTCIGPEFIVRATKPSKEISIKGVKATCTKKVVVILLNGQKMNVTCDPNTATAGQIFEVVVISEGLEDNFTLGLAALLGGEFAFLPPETKLHKVAPAGWCGDSKKHTVPSCVFTLYLRVKFFMPSLRGVRNWTMKHLLYLQLRRSLLEQQIQCDIDQHVALSGLALQSEFGDYSDQEHGHGDYFLLEHYIPESLIIQHADEQTLRKQMQLLHKERQSLDPGRAEEIYITIVQMLKGYGCHFYNAVWVAKDGNNHEMLLEIDVQGLTLYKSHGNERHLHEFFAWKRIQLLSYSKQYLFLMPQYDNKGNIKPTKYKLQMDHKKSSFVFHLASFHHQISMKLRSNVSSLQSLTAEFGVSIKHHLARESRLYHIENNENSEPYRQQHAFIMPAVTLGSYTKHTLKAVGHNDVVRRTEVNVDIADVRQLKKFHEISQQLKQTDLEEHQNKENENPAAPLKQDTSSSNFYTLAVRNEQRKAVSLDNGAEVPNHVSSTLLRNTMNDLKGAGFPQQIRVHMGTKSLIDVAKERHSSYKKECVIASIPILDTSEHSSLQDAYVLNSSIKSAEEKFEVDFQETLSESLLEKFDTLSYKEERILRIVQIRRDESGNLGIQIKAGSDGGLYVQSVVPHGPAAALGTVHEGDQLIAMDGHNLLNLKYEDAVKLFQSSGAEVEIILSQVSTDKGIFESQEEPRVTKAIEEDNEFQLPVEHMKHSDHQDSVQESCISLIRHDLDHGGMSFIPMAHPEPAYAKSVEGCYLNSVQHAAAVDVVSGGGESEMVSTSVATPLKSMQQLQFEEPSTCVHGSCDGIRAICCVLHAEDDKMNGESLLQYLHQDTREDIN